MRRPLHDYFPDFNLGCKLMERWFAACCKPHGEFVAQENLVRQGYRVYLPRLEVRRRRRGQWVDVVEVLFPRYIFIRINELKQSMAPIRSTRGLVGMVKFGGQPAAIDDEVIEALMEREDAGLHRDSGPHFNSGETVRIVDGPLAGMEGVFEQEDGEQRVTVLLDLLGKSNKIRVSRDWIVQAA
jgi:transcriptional antiterminator RfaH